MLELRSVSYRYAGARRDAVRDCSLRVERGERVALVGRNGSGKSTLLSLCKGGVSPSSGEILVDGVSAGRGGARLLQEGVGILRQDPRGQLVSSLVEEELAFGPQNLGIGGEELGRRVREALRLCGVEDLARSRTRGLSGGPMQRVARMHGSVWDGAACGKGDDFAFGFDDVNDALCKAYGVTLDGLKDTACCAIPNAAVHAGDAPAIGTESGRIPFAGDAFAQAGLDRVPRYTDPETASDDGMPRLITGAQSMQMRTYTADAETIAAFAKDMAAQRAWLNPQTADGLGIADGDEAELSTFAGTIRVKVRVTDLISPEAVYVPPHYGTMSHTLAPNPAACVISFEPMP